MLCLHLLRGFGTQYSPSRTSEQLKVSSERQSTPPPTPGVLARLRSFLSQARVLRSILNSRRYAYLFVSEACDYQRHSQLTGETPEPVGRLQVGIKPAGYSLSPVMVAIHHFYPIPSQWRLPRTVACFLMERMHSQSRQPHSSECRSKSAAGSELHAVVVTQASPTKISVSCGVRRMPK